MMEDWTEIIGEELENIEEPLPADDWNVLQQKYAAALKKKRAAAFAWAGGFTSVAAAIALVLMLVHPAPSSVIQDQTSLVISESITSITPDQTTSITPDQTTPVSPDQTTSVIPDQTTPVIPDSIGDPHTTVPVEVIEKPADEVLFAENHTEENEPENPEETFDVIQDTTSLMNRLLADASTADMEQTIEEESVSSFGSLGFDDFPEEESKPVRKPMSISLSGSISGTPVIGMMDAALPNFAPSIDDAPEADEPDEPEEDEAAPAPSSVMMKNSRKYVESYRHEIPISFGVSARFHLTDRLTFNTGLNYTRYTSTRERYYYSTGGSDLDNQYAHYLGIPLRLDWLAVNRKHFNFYFGAGMQLDKCVYAVVGNERLHEKQVLVGFNGAMGIQVNIVKHVGLYFEPEVYCALNDGILETYRSREDLMVTARAGLRFNF